MRVLQTGSGRRQGTLQWCTTEFELGVYINGEFHPDKEKVRRSSLVHPATSLLLNVDPRARSTSREWSEGS